MRTSERERLISEFLRHEPGELDEQFEAVERLHELIAADLAEATGVVVELLQRARTDRLRSYIAAGPLEDIIRKHGLLGLRCIEPFARQNSLVREGLQEVLIGRECTPEVHEKLAQLCALGSPAA